jgi:hypothetical protein
LIAIETAGNLERTTEYRARALDIVRRDQRRLLARAPGVQLAVFDFSIINVPDWAGAGPIGGRLLKGDFP